MIDAQNIINKIEEVKFFCDNKIKNYNLSFKEFYLYLEEIQLIQYIINEPEIIELLMRNKYLFLNIFDLSVGIENGMNPLGGNDFFAKIHINSSNIINLYFQHENNKLKIKNIILNLLNRFINFYSRYLKYNIQLIFQELLLELCKNIYNLNNKIFLAGNLELEKLLDSETRLINVQKEIILIKNELFNTSKELSYLCIDLEKIDKNILMNINEDLQNFKNFSVSGILKNNEIDLENNFFKIINIDYSPNYKKIHKLDYKTFNISLHIVQLFKLCFFPYKDIKKRILKDDLNKINIEKTTSLSIINELNNLIANNNLNKNLNTRIENIKLQFINKNISLIDILEFLKEYIQFYMKIAESKIDILENQLTIVKYEILLNIFKIIN